MVNDLARQLEGSDFMVDLQLHDIIEEADGVTLITVSIPEEFKSRFKADNNMQRFMTGRFKSWFVGQLDGYAAAS